MLRGHARVALAALLACGALLAVPVASNADGCSNEQLRVETGSTRLPDCRAYELVSPGAEKHGIDVGIGENPAPVSTNGERVVYNSAGAFDGATQAGGIFSDYYMGQRSAQGWSSTFLSAFPAPDPNNENNYYPYLIGASPDLSTEFFGDIFSGRTLGEGLWFGHPDGSLQLFSQGPEGFSPAEAAASSSDADHIVLTSSGYGLAAIPGEPTIEAGTPLLYDYSGGVEHLVNADDSGHLLDPRGAELASDEGQVLASRGAVSTDGSRIFFLSRQPGDPSETLQLYVRMNDQSTVELSASQHSAPAPAQAEAMFAGAASDGSRAFFVSSAALTDDATGGGPYLYEYDLPLGSRTGTLKLIAGVQHPVSASVEGEGLSENILIESLANVIVSEDGSHVYYDSPDEGGSVYVYDTASGITGQVAKDATRVRLNLNLRSSEDVSDYPADLSEDGDFLAFGSTADLVPGDVNADEQIYVYDDHTHRLSLASTGSSAPSGSFQSRFFDGYGYRSSVPPNYHLVNDSGEVFFQTPASLVPSDVNGVWDVYEWRDGQTSLISGGRGLKDTVFMGASADGSNVLFLTYDQLVPRDGDDQLDIYDARVNGGFPEPAVPAECSGEGCQGNPTETPSLTAPLSSQYSGPGNPAGAPTAVQPKSKKSKTKKASKKSKTKKKASKKSKAKKKAKARKTALKVTRKSARRSSASETERHARVSATHGRRGL